MNIELTQWEVIEALSDYVEANYGIMVDAEAQLSDYPTISYTESTYAPKKHKNGKVMRHAQHGYTLQEVVKRELKYLAFEETCTFNFEVNTVEFKL